MQRDLNSFPIPPSVRMKLNNAGFNTVAEVLELKPSELSKELNIAKQDALELLRTFKGSAPHLPPTSQQLGTSPKGIHGPGTGLSTSGLGTSSSPNASSAAGITSPSVPGAGGDAKNHGVRQRTSTAFDMLHKEQGLPSIITFCQELDEMLGGGVSMRKITEICGAPGVGKTQMCIQLSVDVQIPSCLGGVGGEAVYIDTEGSFIPQRAWAIAQAASEHCTQLADPGSNPDQESVKDFTAEKILSGIHYFRCHNHIELLALVNLLPEFLSNHPRVKLIAVDSIAFHFRHDFDDMSLRTRLLNGLAQNLIRIATQHSLAVVLTNQMTTKIGNGTSHLVPALGESWGHACTIRLILYWKQAQRYANLYKSPSKKEAIVPYQITLAGVRSVADQPVQSSALSDNSNQITTIHSGDNSGAMTGQGILGDGNHGNENPRKRMREDTVT